MGLFSKETVVCACCGKQFQTRLGSTLCKECNDKMLNQEIQRENDVKGYIRYAKLLKKPAYTQEQLTEISTHRNKILERYNCLDGITKAELKAAGENYKSLSEDQAVDILKRAEKSQIVSTMGASYTLDFFVPSGYERTVVDMKDVFAVAYTTDYRYDVKDHESILCIVFSNDPYLPAFPMMYFGKQGFLSLKSKKGREGVQALFTAQCPNLTYPVQTVKDFKKQLRQEKTVHGNIPMDTMMTFLSDATMGSGVFKDKALEVELPENTKALLDQYRYVQKTDIASLLKLDKIFPRGFWEKIAQNHPECEIELP